MALNRNRGQDRYGILKSEVWTKVHVLDEQGNWKCNGLALVKLLRPSPALTTKHITPPSFQKTILSLRTGTDVFILLKL